ncbi:MAG: helix-turn-helix transcriptional regulator [Planctomycetaceae bacterium]|nr:helix-turn-helix transcriptional regulator [Planctomycetaceae bacterium]
MIDKFDVAYRFFSCHLNLNQKDIAKKYGVVPGAVSNWGKRDALPWRTLKNLCDSQGISWDWLLEGYGDKIHPGKKPKKPRYKKPSFPTYRMNQRFLKLFAEMKYCEIAAELGVTSSTVSEWRTNKSRVPWKRLEYAVERFNVRWDWLIDGIEPKYRESENQD